MTDDAQLIERRLAGLVLEAHRDIQFEGNPTEVAYQFARAVCAIKEALKGAGQRGIDYARLAEASTDESSFSPDSEYAHHVRRLSALEAVAESVFKGADDIDVFIWSSLRLDMHRTKDPQTGLVTYKSCSTRQCAERVYEAYGFRMSKSTIHNRAKKLDRRLDAELARRNFKIDA